MNKMRLLTISVIVLFLLNAATLFILYHTHSSMAADHPHPGEGKDAAGYISTKLKFDEQQQQQFAELRNSHHAFVEKTEEEDKRLHDLYFGMLKSGIRDENKIDSVATLIGEQRKMMAKKTFEHFQQLRDICRDDQKKLYDAAIDEIVRMVVGPHPPPGRPPHH